MKKERIAFVDYIRVIACLLVMMIHASGKFYIMGPVSHVANDDNRLWVAVYNGFLGRISIPLFMIVSAFLLVPMKPGMTMSQFYRRRFLRILPPFVCFLVLYAVAPALGGGLTWNEAVQQLKMVLFNCGLCIRSSASTSSYPWCRLGSKGPVPRTSGYSSASSPSPRSRPGCTVSCRPNSGVNVHGISFQPYGTARATWAIWYWLTIYGFI